MKLKPSQDGEITEDAESLTSEEKDGNKTYTLTQKDLTPGIYIYTCKG